MGATADRIADALRAIAPEGILLAPDVPLINQIAFNWDARRPVPAPQVGNEPAWILEARSLIGQREIPGSKHNPWIATGWQRLKASWFNSDETPWCGFFVAWCLDAAGLSYPDKGEFARALRWATWGTSCTARLGAIATKSRAGGGHVFFIVGETADKRYFKALGGNQSDMVSIVDIAKSDVTAIRWPTGAALVETGLPILPRGTMSGREA